MPTIRQASKASQYDIPLSEDEFGGGQTPIYYTPALATVPGYGTSTIGDAFSGFDVPDLSSTGAPVSTHERGGIKFIGSPLGGTGGGGGAASPIAQVTTQKTVGGGKAPTFTAPTYDESQISKRAQRKVAPYRRALSRELRSALTKAFYENPAVAKEIQRGALAGYGEALSRAMSAAEAAATQEYGAEYARKYQSALDTWKAAMTNYQQDLTQVQSTEKFYTQEDLDTYLAGLESASAISGVAVGGRRTEV